MSAKRTERLLNLLLCLMAAGHAVTRAEVRAGVAGYDASPSDESFERMFERDKEELRGMGIPVETVMSAHGEVEGYRIRREDYDLPEIALTPAELSVLGLAAQVWERAALAPAAASALRKLETAAPGRSTGEPVGVATRVAAPDAALLPLWEAVRLRHAVRFDYRKPGQDRPATRRLEPWGVVSRRGRWYAVGRDRDRADVRAFRLSRIEGAVAADGPDAGYDLPEEVDLEALIGRSAGDDGALRAATVRVAPGRAWSLRRRGAADPADPDLLTLEFLDEESLAADIAAAGADAVALAPPELIAAVRRRLEGALAAQGPAS